MNTKDLENMCKDTCLEEVEGKRRRKDFWLSIDDSLIVSFVTQYTYLKAMSGSAFELVILGDWFFEGSQGLIKSRQEAMKYYQLAIENGYPIERTTERINGLKVKNDEIAVWR